MSAPSDADLLGWFRENAAPWLRDFIDSRHGVVEFELAEALRDVYDAGHEHGLEQAALTPCANLEALKFDIDCVLGSAYDWPEALAELAKRTA